jgi:hypothetical protein
MRTLLRSIPIVRGAAEQRSALRRMVATAFFAEFFRQRAANAVAHFRFFGASRHWPMIPIVSWVVSLRQPHELRAIFSGKAAL